MTVISLQAEIDARRQRPGTEADHKGRCVDEPVECYDPVTEQWLRAAPDPVSACRARSHRSIVAFEASRKDREFARFVGKLKGDAGRDPLDSLCQFGAVCAATQAGFFAITSAATAVMAIGLYQFQMLLTQGVAVLHGQTMRQPNAKKFATENQNVRRQ